MYECPGIEALLVAHKALEELTATKQQADFKRIAATKWTELVFGGLFYEPLRTDLEALIESSQRNVSGTVTLETQGGSVHAIAVETKSVLMDQSNVYAQKAVWSSADAEGFMKIAGNASAIGASIVQTESKTIAALTNPKPSAGMTR